LQSNAETQDIFQFYKLDRELYKGPMSKVYEATSLKNNQKYAIKVIEKARLDANSVANGNFHNEIFIMKIVRHPYLLYLKEMYEDFQSYFMVLPYFKHGNLFERWIIIYILISWLCAQ